MVELLFSEGLNVMQKLYLYPATSFILIAVAPPSSIPTSYTKSFVRGELVMNLDGGSSSEKIPGK